MWGLDFMEVPPDQDGRDFIFLAVDLLSSVVVACPMWKTSDADMVWRKFEEMVLKRHGTPSDVYLDNDPRFMAEFSMGLRRYNIQPHTYPPYAKYKNPVKERFQ